MKRLCVFTVIFLMGAVFAAAGDLIILRDGNIIEGKIAEVSLSELRYRRLDNLEGPVFVIPLANVFSVRYENGTTETFNAEPSRSTQPLRGRPEREARPDRGNTVGFNLNPAGLLTFGPSFCFEFTRNNFNMEINLIYPYGLASGSNIGFGGLFMFNRIWESRIGGFFLGGGMGYIWQKNGHRRWCDYCEMHKEAYDSHLLTLGLNLGYKFITNSGMYFRIGGYIAAGYNFGSFGGMSFFAKPDMTIGYLF